MNWWIFEAVIEWSDEGRVVLWIMFWDFEATREERMSRVGGWEGAAEHRTG